MDYGDKPAAAKRSLLTPPRWSLFAPPLTALNLEEQEPDRQRPVFDKALGLLERPERLGAQALRSSIIKRLSVRPTGRLEIHKALIALSRRERGVRLITTNFDNRFVEPGLQKELVDAAPKLPVPKPHTRARSTSRWRAESEQSALH